MLWNLVRASEAFDLHREEWDDINRIGNGSHILLDSIFVSALLRHFGPPETMLAICRERGHRGMALLLNSRRFLWETFRPSQAPLGLILLEDTQDSAGQMMPLLRAIPGFALCVSVLQQDPDFSAFRNLTESCSYNRKQYIPIARLSLEGSFDDYWNSRSRDLVENLRKRRRRLEDQGIEFRLVEERDPGSVRECIDEYGRLEQSGWKGETGTAVNVANSQGRFYQEVLEQFCTRGEGVIYRLLFNGEAVASNLCVARGRMMVILKIAYDENYRQFSPGFLIRQEMYKRLFSEKRIEVVEFYGQVRQGWTTKWTDEVRNMFHVEFYRYRWVPRAMDTYRRLMRSHHGPDAASDRKVIGADSNGKAAR